jgi:hypothetical protein
MLSGGLTTSNRSSRCPGSDSSGPRAPGTMTTTVELCCAPEYRLTDRRKQKESHDGRNQNRVARIGP